MADGTLVDLTYFWDELVYLPCAIYQIFPWIVAGVFIGMAVNRRRMGVAIALSCLAVALGYYFLICPICILVFPSFSDEFVWLWLRVVAVGIFLAIGVRSLMNRSKGPWEWAAIIAAGILFFEFGLSAFFGDYRGP